MKFAWILTCDKKFLPVNSQKSKTSFAGHAHAYLLINLVFHAVIRVIITLILIKVNETSQR